MNKYQKINSGKEQCLSFEMVEPKTRANIFCKNIQFIVCISCFIGDAYIFVIVWLSLFDCATV